MTITINDAEAAEYLERLKKYEKESNDWLNKRLNQQSASVAKIISDNPHYFGTKDAIMASVRLANEEFIAANPKPKPPSIIPNA